MIRENRYLVLKLSDVERLLNSEEKVVLRNITRKVDTSRLLEGKERLGCVVVEHDWPEYEQVWRMLSERVDREVSRSDMQNCKSAVDNGVVDYG